MVIFETEIEGVNAAEMRRFSRQAQALAKVAGEVDVLISGNRRLRELNRRFRRKDRPTDVLSFPRPAGGDIAISADIARENAARYGHGITQELKVLVLHGMLHLAGYDHESDDGRMARAEARLRARLGLKDSLIARARSNGRVESPRQAVAGSTARKSSSTSARARAGRPANTRGPR
jgi:probable rRNA maturation factor